MEAKSYAEPPPLPSGGWPAIHAEADRLDALIAGKVCRNCQGDVNVTSQDTTKVHRWPGLRCKCGRDQAVLIQAEHPIAERYRTMTNQQVARIEPDELKRVSYLASGREITITAQVVRELFCEKASDIEAFAFLKFCEYNALNPYLREAYIIKYDANKPAQIVIGKMGYTSRAQQQPQYAGMQDGIIIEQEDAEADIPGTVVPKGASLVGGWATVYRSDRAVPTIKRVSMKEYDRQQAEWKTKPATMINKVAIVQATREAFSAMFAKLEDTSSIVGIAGVTVVADTGEILDETPVAQPAIVEPAAKGDTHAADGLYPPQSDAGSANPPSGEEPKEEPNESSAYAPTSEDMFNEMGEPVASDESGFPTVALIEGTDYAALPGDATVDDWPAWIKKNKIPGTVVNSALRGSIITWMGQPGDRNLDDAANRVGKRAYEERNQQR